MRIVKNLSSDKLGLIVQARTNSKRFPGKIKVKNNGKSYLEILLLRLKKHFEVGQIYVATTRDTSDDWVCELAEHHQITYFRGDENDVLSRYYECASLHKLKTIVRITGDCPLSDGKIIKSVIEKYRKRKLDYCSNVLPPTFPDGLDVEVFSFQALSWVAENASGQEREHVTTSIIKNQKFIRENVQWTRDLSSYRLTLDYYEDHVSFQRLSSLLGKLETIEFEQICSLLRGDYVSEFLQRDMRIRHAGDKMAPGWKRYEQAKKVIPGGGSLLSKRPELFAPGVWPCYFESSKGIQVKTLDGEVLKDFSYMGVGTNILGYSNDRVDDAVRATVGKGNMTTFYCYEEVKLAEKLIDMHPWADMARFARSGGEANAIALRIGRAASGKNKVVVCGYHGWHDWYLAVNLQNESGLDNLLLDGLEPNGVNRTLEGTTIPINFSDFEALEELKNIEDIGVFFIEPQRAQVPDLEFLRRVREFCSARGIVLVFDECSSGFRECFGGVHLNLGIAPDLAMFGKALGNGYAVTSVIGRRSVMEYAETTFISSTFWTERIGPTASLACLEEMERTKSWSVISEIGSGVRQEWSRVFELNGIPISINGLDGLLNYSIDDDDTLESHTFITQEMLKKGYLATNAFYACVEHKEREVEEYFRILGDVVSRLADIRKKGECVRMHLEFEPRQRGFKRLNS